MDASGISSVKSQRKCRSIRTALASAALEWFLIFLLFVEAIFSYLITKFAGYYELQSPCLLCSRLDHILGNKKLRYYCELICGKHKLEISSLVFCHAHNKLIDVHGMCENCLFSFATVNKSNAETYRLLVGKLGEGSRFDLKEDALLQDHASRTKRCSCCNELWISREYGRELVQSSIVASRDAEFDAPLSGGAVFDQDNLNKIERSASVRVAHPRSNIEFDRLPHIGYTELKVNSDTESEAHFSDDDDNIADARIREINPLVDVTVGYQQTEHRIITLHDDLASEKLIDSFSGFQTPIQSLEIQPDLVDLHGVTTLSPRVSLEDGLEELHWQQPDGKFDPSTVPELISLDEVCQSSISKEAPIEVSSTLIFANDVLPSLDAKGVQEEASEENIPNSLENVQPSLDGKEVQEEASEVNVPYSLEDVQPSLDAKEAQQEASKENIPISPEDIHTSLDAKEAQQEASKENIPISPEGIHTSSVAEVTLMEASESSKVNSADDVLQSSDSKGVPILISTESNLVSLVDVLPSSSGVETPIQELPESCIPRTEEVWEKAATDSEEICKTGIRSATTKETASEVNPVSGDNGLQAPSPLDLGEAYKLAVGNKGRQLSGALAEQWIGKDSSRLSDDLRFLFSQVSAAREQMVNDSPRVPVSPKLSFNGEKMKCLDASSSIGMQMLQKRISLERNESGLSLDGSVVGEIEGESAVDRLKRQIEHDKKLLSALYEELEEERNASAISTSQAMAMITRLQEEKATLQMEALQYLRMMEEQAEYDMEDLQKTNDLLAEREKEIQDLEAELEFYRNSRSESIWEDAMQQLPAVKAKNIEDGNEERHALYGDKNISNMKNSILDIDDERTYILESLKKLKKRLSLFSNNQLDITNGEYSGNIDGKVNELKEVNRKLGFEVNGEAEKNDELSMQGDKGNGAESISNEYNEMFYSGQSSPLPPAAVDLEALVNEVSDLNERLKALEADRDFLEHSINSIRTGEEGLQFIQEIASHLKKLRQIGARESEHTMA